jgi:hypothetical protein
VEERAGVFQHNARLLALLDELRDKLAQALVAPVKHRRVVVVPDVLVVHHMFEVADHIGGAQVVTPGGDEGLVHVQGVGAAAPNISEIKPAPGQVDGLPLVLVHSRLNRRFRAGDIRHAFDIFCQFLHSNRLLSFHTSCFIMKH